MTAAYSRTAGETVAGSPYTISATLSPAGVLGNYTITYSTANFTITKATASVTPNAASKTYGTADPSFTGTLSGFLAADGVTAAYSRTAGETVAGSPYTVSATLSPAGVLGNYTITYNTANFTITAAAPTVAAVGGTFTYNGSPEAASATALGIDHVTPVAGSFLFTYTGTGSSPYGPSTTPPSDAGSYAVAVVFTSSDPNYLNGSASTAIVINQASSSVGVVSSVNPSTVGGAVSFTATVSSLSTTPTGTVAIYPGRRELGFTGQLVGGTGASLASSSLAPGEHVVTAVYSGDSNFLSSASPFLIQAVNNPLVSIAVTPAAPTIFVGGSEQFAATGTFTDGTSAILPTGGTWALGNPLSNGVLAPMAAAGGNGLLYYFGGQDASGGGELCAEL